MIKKEEMKIVSQREISKSIYELTLQGELVSEMNEPGQFVHVKAGKGIDPLLRRPISISSINLKEKQFTMIYRAEGKGTRLLSHKRIEGSVDVLGPLGNGFPVSEAAKGDSVLLVGGGIGVPPLYELSKRLREKGISVTHVLGFQTKENVFYEEEFSALGETFVVTNDGSYGAKGFVTDVIGDLPGDFPVIYACGPTPMLRAVETAYSHKKLFLSLEERMGCGIGACFACVCHTADDPTGHSYKKVCSDGPVFRAGEVLL
ncbi:dihydroorotate dehydrogenase electron transfer subunit [Bacillus sp. CECT 9360]|uniref:dihydroorotate dehydrogenase electron transfer subunit n=1 Tax=Bacillus sp. CECT 9360 TaxID=2845821 RepID=UPI001E35D5E4|nr:dihydroorotate dehydrogenase electron transfer subunit [Bacillus sp. CECT 9360]CAH0346919.1 Dihydroorotate dehydrogenase B (NAD(+)), electron transfer subunit [Bacillus sp. CECT 9360]